MGLNQRPPSPRADTVPLGHCVDLKGFLCGCHISRKDAFFFFFFFLRCWIKNREGRIQNGHQKGSTVNRLMRKSRLWKDEGLQLYAGPSESSANCSRILPDSWNKHNKSIKRQKSWSWMKKMTVNVYACSRRTFKYRNFSAIKGKHADCGQHCGVLPFFRVIDHSLSVKSKYISMHGWQINT